MPRSRGVVEGSDQGAAEIWGIFSGELLARPSSESMQKTQKIIQKYTKSIQKAYKNIQKAYKSIHIHSAPISPTRAELILFTQPCPSAFSAMASYGSDCCWQ